VTIPNVEDVEFALLLLAPDVLANMTTSFIWERTALSWFLIVKLELVPTEELALKMMDDNMMMLLIWLSTLPCAIAQPLLELFLEIHLKENGVKEFHLVKLSLA
jgi:hypothetical protein